MAVRSGFSRWAFARWAFARWAFALPFGLALACGEVPTLTFDGGADVPDGAAGRGGAGAGVKDAAMPVPTTVTCATGKGIDRCCGAVPCVGNACDQGCSMCQDCSGGVCCAEMMGMAGTVSVTCAKDGAHCGK